MTEQQKKMKKYCNAVERRLNLPRDVKTRVMNDFISSIAARREAGQSDAAIFEELGSPEAVAAELNEQMKEYAYTKSKWRWAALAAAVIAAVMLIFQGLIGLLAWLLNLTMNESSSLGIIGGADGPTAIFVTGVTTTGSGDHSWVIWAMVLAMGILGWWKLGRIKKG